MKAVSAFPIIVALVLSGGITVRYVAARRSDPDLTLPYGRYNKLQMARRAEILSNIIWTEEEQPVFHLDRSVIPVYTRGRPPVTEKRWTADCFDSSERYLGLLEWNAQSGELQRVSTSRASVPQRPNKFILQADAIHRSQRWICALGIAGDTEDLLLKQCTLTSNFCTFCSSYVCVWRCHRSTISVRIDQGTGRLISLEKRLE